MNDARSQRYRTALLAMRQALDTEESLGRDGQKTVTLDQQSVGRLSRMDALQQQAMARATGARRTRSRTRIDAALARLDSAEFGFCVRCGDDIAVSRLDLDPAVPICIACARGE